MKGAAIGLRLRLGQGAGRLIFFWPPVAFMARVWVRPTGRSHLAGMVHSHHFTREEAENAFLLVIETSALTQTEGAAEISHPFGKPTMKPRRFRWWPRDSGP